MTTRTLTVISGPANGMIVEVDRELVVGREAADVTIPDSEISRRHVAVRPVEQGLVVEDLGSLNGTYVDGARIEGPRMLATDAIVRVGRSEIAVHVAVAPADPEDASPHDRTRVASALADPDRTRVRLHPAGGDQAASTPDPPPVLPPPTQVRPAIGVDERPAVPAAAPQAAPSGSAEEPDKPQPPAGLKGFLGRFFRMEGGQRVER